MTDRLTPLQRSYCMSKIKGKDTGLELRFRQYLLSRGMKGFVTNACLPGKPDIFFRGRKTAVFIDGCYWHKCPECFKLPKTNGTFWKSKLDKNTRRDKKITFLLKKKGFSVVRLWEHQIENDRKACMEKIKEALEKANARKPQMENKKGIIAADIFCGAGGLTRGLLDADIRVMKGYDTDVRVKDTYEKNNGGVMFYPHDVRKITKKSILKNMDRENYHFLLAGCAPCQPFSNINRQEKKRDGRKPLLLEFGRLVKETYPDFVFIENVPGLMSRKGERFFTEFLNILDNEGYYYDYETVNMKDYGIPQNRQRLVLLASKYGRIDVPERTHGLPGSGRKPYVPIDGIIKKYPRIAAGEKHPKIPNHETRSLSEINLERLRFTKRNGGARTDLPEHLRLKCHEKHGGHSDVYGRMKFGTVSPALTCKCTSISNGRFGHPTQLRGISVREAAALQTFKDTYIFYGLLTETTKWVGNSVPVKFGRIMGNGFGAHIKKIEGNLNEIHNRATGSHKS